MPHLVGRSHQQQMPLSTSTRVRVSGESERGIIPKWDTGGIGEEGWGLE